MWPDGWSVGVEVRVRAWVRVRVGADAVEVLGLSRKLTSHFWTRELQRNLSGVAAPAELGGSWWRRGWEFGGSWVALRPL